jgi:hypothetical protein
VRNIVASRLKVHADGAWTGLASWFSQLDEPSQRLVAQVLAEKRPMLDAEGVLKGTTMREGAIKNLRNDFITAQLAKLNQHLALPELNDTERLKTLKQIQELRVLKKSPLQPRGKG